MIALLRGTLLEKNPSRLIVDVGGVGYDVQVPLSTFYVLGEAGAEVSLRIYTHVREEVIALYGFATPLEQQLFERLIGISGIGPKLALAVLSGIEPVELIKAIRLQDVARLTAIPGDWQENGGAHRPRAEGSAAGGAPGAGQAAREEAPEDQLRGDLLSALLNLGYQRAVADQAIDRDAQEFRGYELRAGAERSPEVAHEKPIETKTMVSGSCEL